MTAAIPLLRAVLMVLAVFFGVGLGRSFATRGRPRLTTWILRIAAVMLGLCWHGLDFIVLAALVLTAGAAALGYYQRRHPPKEEHLEDVMFPKE